MPSSSGYIAGKALTRWDTDTDNIDIDYRNLEGEPRCKWFGDCFTGRKGMVLKILLIMLLFFIGIIVGYVIRQNVHEKYIKPKLKCSSHVVQDYSDEIRESILKELEHLKNYEQHLSDISGKVYLSGVGETNKIITYVKSLWNFEVPGFNAIHVKKYNVQLSYANWTDPNQVTIMMGSDTIFRSHYNWSNEHVEYAPFNAYAPAGFAKGQLVYANYGKKLDFETLEQANINVTGCIVIMRYGKLHPANKIKHAEINGAIGAILYADPHDYAMEGADTYPSTWWLPSWAVKVSHVRYMLNGDPGTPEYAALEYIHHLPDFGDHDPGIPVQSIRYDDASVLMKDLAGSMMNKTWKGGLDINYKSGPGYTTGKTKIVTLQVNNQKSRRDISNVIGVFRGAYEKDKYVIVGAHVDSWTQGAVGTGSGYAILMELVKSFANVMRSKGWRPRRTVIFALWDASMYGHLGAYEWVQEYNKQLSGGAVAYINLDAVINGNHSFFAAASPMLIDVILNATKIIRCPDPSHPKRTVFDTWLMNSIPTHNKNEPRVFSMQGDGDHAPFLYQLGIPSLSPAYTYSRFQYKYLLSYPAQNTLVDTHNYLLTFIDKNLTLHMTVAKVVAEIILQLSDTKILPLNVTRFAKYTSSFGKQFLELYSNTFKEANISLSTLYKAMDKFSAAAEDFFQSHTSLRNKIASDHELHLKNEQLIQVSRAFVVDSGLPERPHYRNVLMAPHPDNLEDQLMFPGVVSAIIDSRQTKDFSTLKEQLALLVLAFETAVDGLTDGLIGCGMKGTPLVRNKYARPYF